MRDPQSRSHMPMANVSLSTAKPPAIQHLRTAVEMLRASGCSVEVRVTWEGGDAARLAANAAQEGVDVVVAAGGDGTVGEVVSGLMSARDSCKTAVAVVPFGTANDLRPDAGYQRATRLQHFGQ